MVSDATMSALLAEIGREKALFRSFAEQQADLTRVVRQRDWHRLEQALGDLERLAGDIEEAESRRHQRFQELRQELGIADRAGVQLVLSRLPERHRPLLVEHHRELRREVARVRSLTGSLAYYFRYVRDSVDQLLGEMVPHRRGKIYSRHGRAAEGGTGPMLLNRSL